MSDDDDVPANGRIDRSFSLSDGVYDAGARRLTLAAVVIAVGNVIGGAASGFLGSVGLGGVGFVVHGTVFVVSTYLAAGEFLRGIGLVVENAAAHDTTGDRSQTGDAVESESE